MAWREWDMALGPAFGLAGVTTVITQSPQVPFRVEKMFATDTGEPPGTATRIMQLMVGNRIQRPTASGSTSAVFFAPYALGNGLRWDVCQPGLTISVTVSFVVPATFNLSLWGKALA